MERNIEAGTKSGDFAQQLQTLRRAEESFQISIDYNPNHPVNKLVFPNREIKENAVSVYKRLNENIQPIMIAIRTEFRELLGVNL